MHELGLSGLSVLIVEDDSVLRRQIVAHLQRLGADATNAGTLDAAKNLVRSLGYDFVLLDVNLPDGLGTDLLKENLLGTSTGVIVMTADGGVSGAVEAMRLGAVDYLVKPFDLAELPLVIGRARRNRQSARLVEHRRAEEGLPGEGFFFGTTLASLEGQLAKILAADQRVQNHLPPVLIQGETGTGKTTIARWLHRRGPRATQPLVEVNCSALPETLAESELFGHERGAFTDARQARMGLFEAADGGTLLLDELPSLSLPLQAKVLTAIESNRFRRVGGNKEIPVDTRVVAAANCDLREAVAQGRFREDLLHRLDLYRLQIPPLRERGDDILHLSRLLLNRLCRKHRLPQRTITPLGEQRLRSWPWPGNVRELDHELERAIVFEETDQLDFSHLVRSGDTSSEDHARTADWLNPSFVFPDDGFSLEAAVNLMIAKALRQTGNNVSAAARLLGVTRDYVRYRLENQTE